MIVLGAVIIAQYCSKSVENRKEENIKYILQVDG
jgi:hypothetical protein